MGGHQYVFRLLRNKTFLLMDLCSWTRLLTVLVWGATNGLYYRFAVSVSSLIQLLVFLKHDISWLGWMADNVCFVRLF